MTPAPQPELFAPPRHSEDRDVAWLENLLKANKDWMTSTQCIGMLQRPASDDNRRWIRELASRSEWIISGQKGYKHIEHGTTEEINHAANWLESQANKMSKRAAGIRRNAHRILS